MTAPPSADLQGEVEALDCIICEMRAPDEDKDGKPVAVTVDDLNGLIASWARSLDAIKSALLRRLSQPAPTSAPAGAVAWQWRYRDGTGSWSGWKEVHSEDYARQYFRTAQLKRGATAYEVRPLYATPPPPAGSRPEDAPEVTLVRDASGNWREADAEGIRSGSPVYRLGAPEDAGLVKLLLDIRATHDSVWDRKHPELASRIEALTGNKERS